MNIPSVVDIHGLLAEESVQAGQIQKKDPIYKKINNFVCRILKEADIKIVVNDGIKEYFKNKYNITDIFTINNGSSVKKLSVKEPM